MKKLRSLLLWLLLTALISTVACGSRETPTPTREPSPASTQIEIPFETLDRREYPVASEKYPSRDPALFVVAQPEDMSAVARWIAPEVRSELDHMDYPSHFALALFQGIKGTTRFQVQIERILRSGNTITVFAAFQEPGPDTPKGAMETSPYHVVKAKKQGTWGINSDFELNANGKVILTVSHYIP